MSPRSSTNRIALCIGLAAAFGAAAASDTCAQLMQFKAPGVAMEIVQFHGVSDPWFSAQDTAQYYERLQNAANFECVK